MCAFVLLGFWLLFCGMFLLCFCFALLLLVVFWRAFQICLFAAVLLIAVVVVVVDCCCCFVDRFVVAVVVDVFSMPFKSICLLLCLLPFLCQALDCYSST